MWQGLPYNVFNTDQCIFQLQIAVYEWIVYKDFTMGLLYAVWAGQVGPINIIGCVYDKPYVVMCRIRNLTNIFLTYCYD